ncbi:MULTISPECIES: ribosomal protein L7/L12 [unclassified Microbacterium]|uniref:ribosomal protein L7/L12 n=1 Tax=unclassified Microbacterium TaxID=2609290 RepID=UPI00301704A3
MDAVLWIIGIVVGVTVVVVILAFALRGMRPKLPEPQTYTPAPTTQRATPTSSAPPAASRLTPTVAAEIDRLVTAGQKIHAIKLYRDNTGVGLKEAKDRIDHWSVSTTAPHLAAVSHATAAQSAVIPPATTVSSVRSSLPSDVVSQLDTLVAGDQRITAIKVLREQTGLGLKESKLLIDAWVPGRH